MFTETIEFQKRSDLVAALAEYTKDEDIAEVDVVENGRTLRLRRLTEPVDEAPEPVDAVEEVAATPAPADEPGAVLEPVDVEEVAEAVEEAIEEVTDEKREPIEGNKRNGEPLDGNGDGIIDGNEPVADEDDDILGEVAVESEIPVISEDTNRDELRDISDKFNLEIDVPGNGPLQPLRDRITAALAGLPK